ncbi:hypothetical protein DQ400_07850 [Vreelandella sulfidaeris]|uniref:YagK/YfjJ C-terminal domain-containing protein n=1 Tax=Vreelandella sulfidaeris TaxID=115553 RepID=A0A365TRG3_9GAMM|nr:inovirus-type Gp2 protein [Halomonas sulfidaeris]RBI68270.1 hypothetical protein DQ400_07850 [Halomonas sulfidaeris]
MIHKPKRLKANRNHPLLYEPIFITPDDTRMDVMTDKGPLLPDYLEDGYQVFKQAIQDHKRVLVLRFDLQLPLGLTLPGDAETNKVIRRFLSSFQSKIDSHLKRNNVKHKCPVRHIIAREIGTDSQRPHFHVMLLLNGNAFHNMGSREYEGENNFWRIAEAWASALRISPTEAAKRVQCTKKKIGCTFYRLEPSNEYAQFSEAFYRMSYFCKAHTKVYGQRHRGLLTSKK